MWSRRTVVPLFLAALSMALPLSSGGCQNKPDGNALERTSTGELDVASIRERYQRS